MNYDLQYDQLIFNAKLRELYYPLQGYIERHHILPKCIFPEFKNLNKHPENCAVLTAKEHYDAHILLVQMDRYKSDLKYNKLIFAANMMCVDSNGERVDNIRYEWLKIQLSELMKNRSTSKITRSRMSAARKGKSFEEFYGVEESKEVKRKQLDKRLGSKRSETGRKLSIRQTGVGNHMYNHTKYHWVHYLYGERTCTIQELKLQFPEQLSSSGLGAVIRKKHTNHKNWYLFNTVDVNMMPVPIRTVLRYDPELYHWKHSVFGIENCTKRELVEKYPDLKLSVGKLGSVVKQKRNMCMGWTIYQL